MKKKPVLALLVVSFVGAGLVLTRIEPTPQVSSAPKQAPAPGELPPAVPENLAVSKKQLQQMSEMMKQKLLPRLKAMPAEMERMQKMVELNDKLIQQMPDLESQPVPTR